MTTPAEKAAAARKAAEDAARIAAEAAVAADAAEREAADQEAATAESAGAAEGSSVAATNGAAAKGPAPASGSAAAQQIAAGYTFEGAALELGAVLIDGTVDSSALVRIPMKTMNRHGLIAGATGTGKTKTLQGIAEQLSAAGVPVVLADVKGDLSGLAQPGAASDKLTARAAETGDAQWKRADSRPNSSPSAPRASACRSVRR